MTTTTTVTGTVTLTGPVTVTARWTAAEGRWTEIDDPETLKIALSVCRGRYQENVVLGHEALSGSTLKGKAASYKGHYQRSIASMIGRLRDVGITVSERTAAHNRRVLVLGPVDWIKNQESKELWKKGGAV